MKKTKKFCFSNKDCHAKIKKCLFFFYVCQTLGLGFIYNFIFDITLYMTAYNRNATVDFVDVDLYC